MWQTILQGKGKHCTIVVFFVMFVMKSGGTMRDGGKPHVTRVQGPGSSSFFLF